MLTGESQLPECELLSVSLLGECFMRERTGIEKVLVNKCEWVNEASCRKAL